MRLLLLVGAVVVGGIAIIFMQMGSADKKGASSEIGAPLALVTLPASLSAEAELGKQAFEANCVACHGVNAAGIDGSGPPLIHKIYEPSHHGDLSFFMAAQNGVRAHHWPFGNMPPVEGTTEDEVKNIIAYIRELQHANGIN